MNILLVYPRYPETFWSFKHVLKFISKKAAYPPLGLLTVASLLPKDWNIRLIDMNVRELEDRHIAWADMVFVSAMLVQMESARAVAARCRALGRKVVAGGPAYITGKEKNIDHFVLGEAEVTLPRFLHDLDNNKLKKVYRSKKRPDITKTPIPMWSLINFRDYATMALQYSRGCPFNCEFCDIIIMSGRVPRAKTPLQFIRELESLHCAGWKGSVFIVDDNFIGSKAGVKGLLRHLIKWQRAKGFPYKFFTEASINLAQDPELMQLMSRANFDKVFLGLETPDRESLKECSKVQNTIIDIRKAVQDIHRHGMQVMGGFILGFDHDNEGIFDAQVRFIQKIGVVTAMVGVLTALPKTQLWQRLKKEGRLVKDASGENAGSGLNFMPKMGREQLMEGYRKVLARIYSRKLYYKRINEFIRQYRPTAKGRISVTELKAFARSMWSIGLLSSSRFQYWRLIIRTAIVKYRALPMAIELSIYGLHYERFALKA